MSLLVRMSTLIALLVLGLSAAKAADFYAGKQITLIQSGTGGAYDAYSRAFARCMPNHIPGKPNIIVQGMPGAGGVVAANHLYNVVAKDGTIIGGVHGNVLVANLLTPEVARFDPAKFNWLGNGTHDTYVGYVMADAPIKTLAEAKATEVLMAGTNVGAGGVDMAILGRDLLGFKFKIVSGYKSSSEVELALQRGEAHGTFGHAWGSLKTRKMDWVREGKIRIIVQHGLTHDDELPDVPLISEFATTDLQREILKIELVRQDVSKPFLAPPGVPAENVAMLRSAFKSCLTDADFLAEIKQRNVEFDRPMDADEVSAIVAEIAKTPPEASQKLRDLLNNFRG